MITQEDLILLGLGCLAFIALVLSDFLGKKK
jgi:hypothetical protein